MIKPKRFSYFKSLALFAMVISASANADINGLALDKQTQLDIEQIPGVYFESDTYRENPTKPELKDLPLQIQKLDTIPLASGKKFFANQDQLQMGTLAAPETMATTEAIGTPAERSGCPTLALNSAVYTNFSAEGQLQCYSVEVSTATKIEGLLGNIPTGVDYDLYFFRLEDNNSFTVLDLSNSSTATLEKTVQKVEPGVYILAAQATQGVSPTPAIMGWFSYPDFDQQESNDKVSQATALTPTAVIQGNIDNVSDLDYFTYHTGPAQTKIYLNFSASEQFSFELWTGSNWAKISNDQLISINVSPGAPVLFLARGVTDNMPSVSAQYALTITDPDAATTLKSTYTWNNEALNEYHFSYRTKAHQYIGMSGTVTDDNGQPVPFAEIEIELEANDIKNGTYPGSFVRKIGGTTVRSDNNGKFSVAVTLPDCDGQILDEVENRTAPGTQTHPRLVWEITYNEVDYKVILKKTDNITVDPTYADYFTHVCTEKLISYSTSG